LSFLVDICLKVVKCSIDTIFLYRYDILQGAPIVLVGYSFGGLVLKSLVVEVQQHTHQRITNLADATINRSCKSFLQNLKGRIFYGVPHAGGSEGFFKYFSWKCQQINTMKKKIKIHSSLLKNLTSFNRQMEELSVDFEKAITQDLIIYAFNEGRPLEEKWVSF
jgi:surfactin synthase thioesterase subunit